MANVPDFIPEGKEHLYLQPRDRKGQKRDFYPEEPGAFVEAHMERKKGEAIDRLTQPAARRVTRDA